jgi:hypothetical protein
MEVENADGRRVQQELRRRWNVRVRLHARYGVLQVQV